MFVRVSTLVLAIAASAIAAPGSATPTTITSSECDTGDIQCCNNVTTANDVPASALGLLGISVPINGLLGFGCSPITPIGIGSGATCQQQPVCCSGNSATGLINVICSPVNLDL